MISQSILLLHAPKCCHHNPLADQVGLLQSKQLRQLVQDSLDSYVAFFEQYRQVGGVTNKVALLCADARFLSSFLHVHGLCVCTLKRQLSQLPSCLHALEPLKVHLGYSHECARFGPGFPQSCCAKWAMPAPVTHHHSEYHSSTTANQPTRAVQVDRAR